MNFEENLSMTDEDQIGLMAEGPAIRHFTIINYFSSGDYDAFFAFAWTMLMQIVFSLAIR